MNLIYLLKGVDFTYIDMVDDLEIENICYDSRKVTQGSLFICIKGYKSDGHLYAKDAVSKGAVALIVEDDLDLSDLNVAVIKTTNSRRALSIISSNFYDNPASKMKIIGITGTNGKTTCTYLLKSILESCGYKVGLIGTNQNMILDEVIETHRTTPESLELHELFLEMVNKKVDFVIMEVSSHSLILDRVYGIEFEIGIFTNISQDHLDFHNTMDEYAKAKSILFSHSKISILNADDKYYPMMKKEAYKALTYGIDNIADISASDLLINAQGVSFNVNDSFEEYTVMLKIPGKFSVYNALAVIGACTYLKIPYGFTKMALRKHNGVKGRLEVLDLDENFTVIIDYAHSPDGLYNILTTINEFKKGRLVTLFGCGGDRDKTKRPKMGKIAGELSDFLIVTSDNPRTENGGAIIKDIMVGVNETSCENVVIENRFDAINYALTNAKPDDIIVLAGKGHETYQEIDGIYHDFDEREVVAKCLSKFVNLL